ncbi:MAG: metalloregulator ArsR/SmtB family transcription factor [Chroococcidiopsidaceae cyanobacterium CP_BM_ER_R8_30]|nr:metalloregulator ArsR/SmtB family transcription factor [Chroococcidiopsidaceae cyanobacterium CP_BM_ER_R8_30]
MGPDEFQTLLRFFKALANESRLKMVGLLAGREYSVEELAALLQLKEPTVSHHLSILKELNLVQLRPEGNTHWYQLDREALHNVNRSVFDTEQIAGLVKDVEADAWERQVLSNFLSGERLKEIPASRKKRWVILKWLVSQFDLGVTYPEANVNEIIKRHHPDCATLRRELIGYQMLQREHGLYWRQPEAEWKFA